MCRAACSRPSVTFDSADTTTTGGSPAPARSASFRTIALTRRIAASSATDVPPNFMTTLTRRTPWRVGRVGQVGLVEALSQQALPTHELGVENRGARRTADRVVAERDELVVEDRARPQAAHRHRHAVIA